MVNHEALSRGAKEMLDAYLLGQPVTVDQLSWWIERLLNSRLANHVRNSGVRIGTDLAPPDVASLVRLRVELVLCYDADESVVADLMWVLDVRRLIASYISEEMDACLFEQKFLEVKRRCPRDCFLVQISRLNYPISVACAPLSDKVTMTRDDVLPAALAALRSVDRLWYALVG